MHKNILNTQTVAVTINPRLEHSYIPIKCQANLCDGENTVWKNITQKY